MGRIVVMMCVAGFAVAALLVFVLAKGQRVDPEEPVACDDVMMKPLQDLNPGLRLEKRSRDRFDGIPVFWAVDPASGRAAMLPRGEVEGCRIEILPPSAVAEIPKRLRYPGASEPVCVRITEDDGDTLDAFSIEVKGRIRDVVTFYDGPDARAQAPWEDGHLPEMQPDGSWGLGRPYFVYETERGGNLVVRAFVGYRESR